MRIHGGGGNVEVYICGIKVENMGNAVHIRQTSIDATEGTFLLLLFHRMISSLKTIPKDLEKRRQYTLIRSPTQEGPLPTRGLLGHLFLLDISQIKRPKKKAHRQRKSSQGKGTTRFLYSTCHTPLFTCFYLLNKQTLKNNSREIRIARSENESEANPPPVTNIGYTITGYTTFCGELCI